MAWYKLAKDFSERNIINYKIRFLSKLQEDMEKLSQLVFQSGRLTKHATTTYIHDDALSSYPILKDMIVKADSIVYDSPWRFSELSQKIAGDIGGMIKKLERERKEMSLKKEKFKKGWFVND